MANETVAQPSGQGKPSPFTSKAPRDDDGSTCGQVWPNGTATGWVAAHLHSGGKSAS